MNTEWKMQWVAALRSREFKQGRGQLRSDGEDDKQFCCLGVLCEVTDAVYNPHSGHLPRNLMRQSGITRDQESQLIRMNDQQKLPFSMIADWIEKNL